MSKKHSYEYVKQFFKENGCELLETEYINNRTSMKYRCNCDNISYISFGNFQLGCRCMKCARQEKFTMEHIKKYFEDNGCELLETEYISIYTKMKYKCSCGNISETTFKHFKNGHRCKQCGNEKMIISRTGKFKPFLHEYVKKYFEDNECVLLESEYINSSTKMKYICICGNESEISFSSFKRGVRCKECGIKKRIGENHYKWNPDREEVEKNKYYINKYMRLIHNCLNKIGKPKEDHTNILLGYSAKELQIHLESHPNYEKVDHDNYHIDHILPIKAFLEHDIYDTKLINALENLQPLDAYENLSKADKYLEEDFYNYCNKRGITF